jgi:hypothetical protein
MLPGGFDLLRDDKLYELGDDIGARLRELQLSER